MLCPACNCRVRDTSRFCSDCGAQLGTRLDAQPGAVAPSGRRQLTGLFCDIVDSTGIAERMDAEDFRELVLDYRHLVTEIVHRNQGQVARLTGDGILAHFGFPAAREDDARLAVRSALEIRGRIPALSRGLKASHGIGLDIRIGIHTGLVVVGEGAPAGERPGDGLVGSALNIGARLQELAPPGGIVVSQDTFRLVQGHFIVQTLGPRRLKGVSHEIQVHLVLDSSSARSLFEARATTGLAPFVARQAALELLAREWSLARQGAARSVLVTGEPGIGKSRLLHEFQKQIDSGDAVQITCNCSPQYANTAFHPVATELARVFAIGAGDDRQTRLAKVQAALDRLGIADADGAERLELVLACHSQPGAAATADARRQAIDVLRRYVEAVATHVPLLLIFEDLHWADPSTLEFLGHLCRAIRTGPLLVLASTRPREEPAFAPDTSLVLGRFDPADCTALIAAVAGDTRLAPDIVDQLVDRSDGVPLFLEELTKSVKDALGPDNARADAPGPPASLVPASLHDGLMARLDRMGSAKAVAQMAAAIGRSFRYGLLATIWGGPRDRLGDEVDRLVAAEIVFEKMPRPPGGRHQAVFEFKHELVRSIAYESLLRTARRRIHHRIADALDAEFAEEAARHPELLAHHCSQAGLADRAIGLWDLAGQKAVCSSSSREAVAHFSRALELLATMPPTPAAKARELALQLRLAAPLMAAKGHGSPDLDRTVSRALALSTELGDTAAVFPLVYARWSYQQVTGEVSRSLDLAEQAVMLAERNGGTEALMIAYRLLGTSLQVTGRPAEARPHLERALALFDAGRHAPLVYVYGADVAVMALCSLALTCWTLGQDAAAAEALHQAEQRAAALGHATTAAYCGGYRGAIWALRGDVAEVEALVEQQVRLATDQKLPVWRATAGSYAGWAFLQRGDPAAAVLALRESLDAMQACRVVYWQPMAWAWLGEAHAAAGSPDEAEAAFERSAAVMQGSGERWAEPELYRLWAEARHRAARPDAGPLLRRAAAAARAQRAPGWARRIELASTMAEAS